MKSGSVSADVYDYVVAHGTPPDPVQQRLIAETQELGGIGIMQIAPDQGALMTMLTRLLGVQRAVEVGTFTGYSALSIARGLPADGSLLCCDISEEWTSIAKKYWEEAGVADRIELSIGPALDTLRALPEGPTIDLAFIDADKPGYIEYHEEIVTRLRPGGLILVDNVLAFGKVTDPKATDENVRAIRDYNEHVLADERVDQVMLPIADGLTFITLK